MINKSTCIIRAFTEHLSEFISSISIYAKPTSLHNCFLSFILCLDNYLRTPLKIQHIHTHTHIYNIYFNVVLMSNFLSILLFPFMKQRLDILLRFLSYFKIYSSFVYFFLVYCHLYIVVSLSLLSSVEMIGYIKKMSVDQVIIF